MILLFFYFFTVYHVLSDIDFYRIQNEHHPMLNVLYECVFKDPLVSHQWDEIIPQFMSIIESPLKNIVSHGLFIQPSTVPRHEGVVLITQYYLSPHSQADIDEVLQINLNNEAISSIVLLNEAIYDVSSFKNHNKITQVNLQKRLQFSDAFEYANRFLVGKTVVLGKHLITLTIYRKLNTYNFINVFD